MFQITQKLIGYDQTNRELLNTNTLAGGFSMTFENGYTISVQFGFGDYCENTFQTKENCKDAEIAILDKDGNYYLINDEDTVKGYCTPDEVANYIQLCKNL